MSDDQEPVFNPELLEKRMEELKAMHTAEPTEKFIKEELERCQDPRYFYNTYWAVNGKAVEPLSEEEWNERSQFIHRQRSQFHSRRPSRIMTPDDCYRLKEDGIIFISPDASETKPSQEL